MRSYLYLSTAVAGVMMTAGAGVSFAQCVTTQNCAELGPLATPSPAPAAALKSPPNNAPNSASLTPAPALTKPAPVNPATASMRLAPVPHLILGVAAPASAPQHINTPAPARATLVVLAPPAAASMRLAPAPTAMSGKMVVVKNKSSTAPKANCIIATARWLVSVLQVWASMLR